MSTEKKLLEKATIDYFINIYPTTLKLIKHTDKPDFILYDESNHQKLGIEITHLYYNQKEARILLNKYIQRHGSTDMQGLINSLNNLLLKKCTQVKKYSHHIYDKLILVIRVANLIFNKSDFDKKEKNIICPNNIYDEIYLLLPKNNTSNSKWDTLKKIK